MKRRTFLKWFMAAAPVAFVASKLAPETQWVGVEMTHEEASARFSGYADMGNYADLSDLIYDIEPTETPILSMMKNSL